MPLKSFKGYNRRAAALRAGAKCACDRAAVDYKDGPVCARCLDWERWRQHAVRSVRPTLSKYIEPYHVTPLA